jgi:hypothetical protein
MGGNQNYALPSARLRCESEDLDGVTITLPERVALVARLTTNYRAQSRLALFRRELLSK